MLGMKKYSKDYVNACRARIDADVRVYRKHVGTTSILKLRAGDEVKVREADFARLSEAFFREIEKKHV
jgi:hypothetical protein